jgi:hypothetical protein
MYLVGDDHGYNRVLGHTVRIFDKLDDLKKYVNDHETEVLIFRFERGKITDHNPISLIEALDSKIRRKEGEFK